MKIPFKSYYQLTKPRITMMVLIGMSAGYWVTAYAMEGSLFMFLKLCFGVFCVTAGTSSTNQVMEHKIDGLMKRTSSRPIPTGDISIVSGWIFSIVIILFGVIFLWFWVSIATACVTLLSSIIYILFYTPMKVRSSLSLYLGAIPGALPPIGGAFVYEPFVFNLFAFMLFLIMFLWQIPHVIAIAKLCEEDYRNVGIRLFSFSSKRKTAVILIGTLLFMGGCIVTLYFYHNIALLALVGMLVVWLHFTFSGYVFVKNMSTKNSKKMLLSSIMFIPLVWIILLINLFWIGI